MPCDENAGILNFLQPINFIEGRIPKSYPARMNESDYKQFVGSRLEMAIEALGLKKVDVCRVMGVSQPKLNHWCHGRHYPDPYFVYRFCERYGITFDWVFRGAVALPMSQALADALWQGAEAFSLGHQDPAAPVLDHPIESKSSRPSKPEHKVNIARAKKLAQTEN